MTDFLLGASSLLPEPKFLALFIPFAAVVTVGLLVEWRRQR